MATIKISPSGKTFECQDGGTVFEYGQKNDADIETACVGKGTCGLCRIKIIAGEENLSEQTPKELQHLGNVYFINKVRLACQTIVEQGEVTIEVIRKKPLTKKKKNTTERSDERGPSQPA